MSRIKNDLAALLSALLKESVLTDPHLARTARRCLGYLSNPPHSGSLAENVDMGSVPKVETALQGIDHCLIGGLAVAHYVHIRQTQDLDFIVATRDFNTVLTRFPGGKMGNVVYSVDISGVSVDFMIPDYVSWIDDALHTANLVLVSGHHLKVVSPEYLILFKLYDLRAHDESDIIALLRDDDGLYKKTLPLVRRLMPSFVDDLQSMQDQASLGGA